MKVLVTGGAGYLGSLLSTYLIEKGMHVVVYDNMLYGGESLLPLFSHPRFQLIIGDIRDITSLSGAVKKVNAVVHLAALVGEDACLIDPAATEVINVQATQKLVKIAIASGVKRIIFSSTCSNYGISDVHTIATEVTKLKPLSLYSQTKISSEKKISIFAPNAWRPFLHIRDAVEVIYQCLTVPAAQITHQIFNVVGENYQKQQLAQLVIAHCPQAQIVIKKDKVDARDYRVSGERIARKLNFYPNYTIEEAFIEIVQAVKNGVLIDPFRAVYEALPDIKQLN